MIEEPASQYLQALEEYCIYKQRGLKALTIAEIQYLETINELKRFGKKTNFKCGSSENSMPPRGIHALRGL